MLAVLLTISVIFAAVLFGSLIPQGLPHEIYIERYGEGIGRPFLALGLDDIYRSKGFALLGIVLFMQLLFCTGKRVALLRGGLKAWAVGSILLHVGLLIFLVSVGVSLWWGKIVTVEVPEGKVVSLQPQGVAFDLRLDRFEIDYYPDNRAVRQYKSDITLLRGSHEIKQGTIEVNSPMGFEGAKIYQMHYGWILEGSVRKLPNGKAEPFSVQNGAWVNWSGAGKERLRVVIMTDPDKNWVTKPEAAFLFLGDGGARRTGSVVIKEAITSGDVEVRFDGIRRFSGLQVKEDPGIPGVFAGLAVALSGLVLRYVPMGRRSA